MTSWCLTGGSLRVLSTASSWGSTKEQVDRFTPLLGIKYWKDSGKEYTELITLLPLRSGGDMSPGKVPQVPRSWSEAPLAFGSPRLQPRPARAASAGCSALLAELRAPWRQSGSHSLWPGHPQAERRARGSAQGACAKAGREGSPGEGADAPGSEARGAGVLQNHLLNRSRRNLSSSGP